MIESLAHFRLAGGFIVKKLDQAEILKARTKQFAVRIVNVVRSLPTTREGNVLGNQLLRCGTTVAANYRGACRSRSHAEFISKMSIVVEEADETVFWLELLYDTGVVRNNNSPIFNTARMRFLRSVPPLCALPNGIGHNVCNESMSH